MYRAARNPGFIWSRLSAQSQRSAGTSFRSQKLHNLHDFFLKLNLVLQFVLAKIDQFAKIPNALYILGWYPNARRP